MVKPPSCKKVMRPEPERSKLPVSTRNWNIFIMLTRLLLCFPLLIFAAFAGWIFPTWLGILSIFLIMGFGLALNLYPDKFLLHFLQAREITETEFPFAHQVASNQAFKLRLSAPQVYTYNGFFHRAFAFSSGKRSVLVIERTVLTTVSKEELEALLFSLGLQIKDGIAKKSTFALLSLAVCWVPYLKMMGLWKSPPQLLGWLGQFIVSPAASLLHRVGYNQMTCQKFLNHLSFFPYEESRLQDLNGRFDQPKLHLSVARDLTFRAGAASHGPREQMILALEAATHLMDYLSVISGENVNA